MAKAADKWKAFLKHVVQIWGNGSEAIPVSLAVDPCKLVMAINLDELQEWREFRMQSNAAEADRRQAKVEASLAMVGSCLRDAQAQIEAAQRTMRAEPAHIQDPSQPPSTDTGLLSDAVVLSTQS